MCGVQQHVSAVKAHFPGRKEALGTPRRARTALPAWKAYMMEEVHPQPL